MGYLANFIVYTLAMAGVMGISLLVFKKFALGGCKSSSGKCLKVLDTMPLGPRKTLYIVSAGSEKFLIAGDIDRTTFISKLGEKSEQVSLTPSQRGDINVGEVISTTPPVVKRGREGEGASSFQETMSQLNKKTRYADKSIIGIKSSQNTPYTSVMRSLAERIKE